MDARHSRAVMLALVPLLAAGCQVRDAAMLDRARRAAIADSLTALIHRAYDLKAEDVVANLMSLYPDTGRVISASGGRVTTTRDSLEAGIRSFWEYVGRNMQDPKWTWGPSHVDVLSPDAAVLTTTYRVPHRTPAGEPHTIAGAWTAVFARRDGRWVIVQEHLSEIPPEALQADTAAAGDAGHAGHTSQ
jgi:ketosteroid isomerase-like protein